jgi:SHS2 domain-containing protein
LDAHPAQATIEVNRIRSRAVTTVTPFRRHVDSAYCSIAVMTRSVEVIEHTADVGIVARGETVEDVFLAAAEGMLSFIIRPDEVRPAETRRRTVEADDRAGLLAAWLNDLILLLNADGFVAGGAAILECSETRMVADVRGEPVDPTRHHFRLDVKAATYHQLAVNRTNGWEARVIFDV